MHFIKNVEYNSQVVQWFDSGTLWVEFLLSTFKPHGWKMQSIIHTSVQGCFLFPPEEGPESETTNKYKSG